MTGLQLDLVDPTNDLTSWVCSQFGVQLRTIHSPVGLRLPDLVGLALRRNPRRAHLLVSTVLGKHVPVDPRVVIGTGRLLGALVADLLLQRPHPPGLSAAAVATVSGIDPAALLAGLPAPKVPNEPVLVLGFAETATALGHLVADQLNAAYIHSTRRAVPGVVVAGGFEEGHSHATSHLLLPVPESLLHNGHTLILVDDELSTGKTAISAIRALHHRHPRSRYILASLIDLRSAADEQLVADLEVELDVRIDAVSLVRGEVELPVTMTEDAANRITGELALGRSFPTLVGANTNPPASRIQLSWDGRSREGGRHGFPPAHRLPFNSAVRLTAAALEPALGSARRVLVVGTEEFMYLPLRIAMALAENPLRETVFQSTTRSPVQPFDEGGYPIRRQFSFADPEGEAGGVRYLYNASWPTNPPDDLTEPDVILVVVDADADSQQLFSPNGLVASLARGEIRVLIAAFGPSAAGLSDAGLAQPAGVAQPATHTPTGPAPTPAETPPEPTQSATHTPPSLAQSVGYLPVGLHASSPSVAALVRDFFSPSNSDSMDRKLHRPTLPEPLHGPGIQSSTGFGSYAADEVSWLLTDLSHLSLEADTAARERSIQSGQAHYAESLPIEYQPDPAYRRLFDQVLAESAERLATAVGLVTEIVLAERGPNVVLASMARAGTPIGVLMRRWAGFRHGIKPSHYALSIVRGRGIDRNALRYIAAHHDPADVVFVDGWTGKGAIVKELRAALTLMQVEEGLGFNDDLAVLADPGRCVRTFGTRDDFLIASACLNSTVSGLVSRTVLNDKIISANQYHGAKFYSELAGDDMSNILLDKVTERFAAVRDTVDQQSSVLANSHREPTFTGWAAVERIRQEYGIDSVNFVKPGVGETTRVLLRRVPWRVLVREADHPDHAHIRLLALDRGVPVEVRPDLPYSCVGLIRPLSSTDRGEG